MSVTRGEAERGIVLCGSGVGASRRGEQDPRHSRSRLPRHLLGAPGRRARRHERAERSARASSVRNWRSRLVRAFVGARFSGEERHLRRLNKVLRDRGALQRAREGADRWLTRSVELYEKQRQSPWLDFIRRNMLHDGGLKRYIEQDGIRGVTANPTIFAQAIGAGDDYDAQIADLDRGRASRRATCSSRSRIDDIRACRRHPAPGLRRQAAATASSASRCRPTRRSRRSRRSTKRSAGGSSIDRPNLMVKIPATNEGHARRSRSASPPASTSTSR